MKRDSYYLETKMYKNGDPVWVYLADISPDIEGAVISMVDKLVSAMLQSLCTVDKDIVLKISINLSALKGE